MATVFRAYDPRFRREVAVKVLPREFLHDQSFRARFDQEAEIIASLEHPAIVPVYDFGEDNGQPYLVMRLMTGGSLADQLDNGPLPLITVARILSIIAPAIDRAHKNGIIHRDIKPQNILFDEDGNPYISDFGIAKLVENTAVMTATGMIGTPAYMSPEQARGEKDLDSRSDIYSLGVMIFQMLTGRLPYEGDSAFGIALKHVNEPVPHIRIVRPELPRRIDTLITKVMAKRRNDRYPTAGALASELTFASSTESKPQVAQDKVRRIAPTPTLTSSVLNWRPVNSLRRSRPILLSLAALSVLACALALLSLPRLPFIGMLLHNITPTLTSTAMAVVTSPAPAPSATIQLQPVSSDTGLPSASPTVTNQPATQTRQIVSTLTQTAVPTSTRSRPPTSTSAKIAAPTATLTPSTVSSGQLKLISPVDITCPLNRNNYSYNYASYPSVFTWSYPLPLPPGWNFEARHFHGYTNRDGIVTPSYYALRTHDQLSINFDNPWSPYPDQPIPAYWEVAILDQNDKPVNVARYTVPHCQ